MKKIILLLFFILSFDVFAGFETTTQATFVSKKSNFPSCSTSVQTSQSTATTGGITYYYDTYDRRLFRKVAITSTMYFDSVSGNQIYGSATVITYTCSGSGTPICTTKAYLDGLLQCKSDTDPDPDFIPNPKNAFFDDDGSIHCESGFKDVAGTCYQELENGWLDDEGKYQCDEGFYNPTGENCIEGTPPPDNPCGDGYAKTGTNGLTGEDICYPDSDGNGTADIMENNLPPAPDVPVSGVQIDGNGTKRWNVGGNTYELTTDGTLTTTYADGTKSVSQVGSDYYNSGSSGGSSSGGTGGSGSNGQTNNETNPNTNDTPVDDTPASNSCQDSSLTLQEKMLCEMNAGMKKLNSESNTENSLNNLLKDLNNTSNTNATAINTNIKETNKKLDSVKALNENLLKEQKRTNEYLVDVENSVSTSNVLLQNVVGAFTNNNSETFENSLEGSGNLIDSFTGQYTTFYNNMLTQKDTLESLLNNTQNTINQGFSFSLDNKEITSCPLVYDLDFSSVGMNHHIPLNVDLCLYSSYIKPIMYPIFLIFLSIGTTFLAFNIIIRLI